MKLLIVVNEKGFPIGEATVEECHKGNGLKHLAFVVFIFNSKGEVLIQKRAKNKRFSKYWEVPASHFFKNEDWKESIKKTLKRELGIDENLTLKELFAFSYFVKNDTNDEVENEYCFVYACKYDGKIIPNEEEVEEVKFVNFEELNNIISNEKVAEWLKKPFLLLKDKKVSEII